MPDNTVSPSTTEGSLNADLRGVHYDFLKDRVPDWFNQGTPQRQQELADHELELPGWYLNASAQSKAVLADRHTQYRQTLNRIEAELGRVQDVLDFAEQPLKDAIKQRFNLELDVRQVFFARKYAFKGRDDFYGAFVFDQQKDPALSYRYRGMSVLEAALANFSLEEEQPGACADCEVITRFGAYDGEILPTFSALNAQAVAIAPHEFAGLCRTLDLGKQYQDHLKTIVQPEDKVKREALEQQLQELYRQQLVLCSEVAAAQFTSGGGDETAGGISADAYRMLQQLLTDPRSATLDGRPVTVTALNLFGSMLVGPLLIGPERSSAERVERLVAYIPHDPEQPLTEYASSADFMVALRARLHSGDYRRFFSRFVPQREQGAFFQRFDTLYQPAGGGNGAADYPLQSRPVKLPLADVAIDGDLWEQMRDAHVRKIFADARAVAVPTADEDRETRMARLDSYLDAVLSVFNLAAFMVPGLGPIMLAVGAAQMASEVFEGFESFEQGDIKSMWAHFSSVALNAAFIGTGAKVLPQVRVSSVVDNLRPVTVPSGKQRLWKPELTSYEHTPSIPEGVSPDELGLHNVNGKTILPVNGKRYAVQQDPVTEEYRITHPTRPDAYQPKLTSNGSGLWNHELERPLTWEGATLMRRLGPVTEGFSDVELEQVRRTADVSEDVLRRVHVEGEPVPAILLDTLRQFRAYGDAVRVAEGIRAGSLSSELCSYAASLLVELPGWPANKAIEAFAGDELSGPSIKYGNSQAVASDTVRINRTDLMNGQLPKRVIESLNETQLDELVGRYTARTPEARTEALQSQLEQHAIAARSRLMSSIYVEQQPPSDAAIMLLQRDFKRLPTIMARELLADATPAERDVMLNASRIPLRIAQKARLAQQQMRLTLAYEGLHLDAVASLDTEALVLNSVSRLPGWTDNLRLEVREGRLEGELRASFGPPDAAERKVLVRMGDGRYQARNVRDEHLHGIDDLYASLQHALTDRHRQALGLPHIKQGAALKTRIIEHALPREQLRQVLKMQPGKRPFFKTPMRLSGERIGYPLSDHGQPTIWRQALEPRIRELYPTFLPQEVSAFIDAHGTLAGRVLRGLKREYTHLNDTLQDWQRAQVDEATPAERTTPEFTARRHARLSIVRALKQAWQRTGEPDLTVTGESQGQFLDFAGEDLHDQLAQLPPLTANFDHVSNIDLSGTGLSALGIDNFLLHFPRLRRLDLSNNRLVSLPEPIARMTRLNELDLSDNLIELEPAAVSALRGLTHLNYLALEGNPLEMSPDISQMPYLNILRLADTGLTAWPTGVFEQPRDTTFFLDLSHNPLQQVPAVAPGSAQAHTVARTQISQTPEFISEQNLQLYRAHRASVGMDLDRVAPPRGIQDNIHWRAGLSDDEWLAKQGVWNSLEYEPGAEPFFNELLKLADSADALAPDEAVRAQLTGKVWQMVEAAASDSALRKRLFEMAAAPTSCVDAGAQLFNAMGLEVLVWQAHGLGTPAAIERQLLTLARGKSRLDALGKIAKDRISALYAQGRRFPRYDAQGALVPQRDAQGNPIRTIDEVEIHFIYPTRLAERLELPWQSRNMRFIEPDVTPQMIEAAYTQVLAQEAGALITSRLLDQPFWKDFLRQSDPQAFSTLRARDEALTDAASGPTPTMSDAEYHAGLELLAADEKALFTSLTRQAIERAGWATR
ncbi:NEL-type E3 ubiquitin ligase domain-containing protein [Pseudomonas sp. L1(2025)]|uniref:NEL-type E3 ubiquitin ligase domain-containing protein n=1 Tax=Pseudomonas sp. L1(2025) TaxID=3449429 RepID=UPI003F68ED5B